MLSEAPKTWRICVFSAGSPGLFDRKVPPGRSQSWLNVLNVDEGIPLAPKAKVGISLLLYWWGLKEPRVAFVQGCDQDLCFFENFELLQLLLESSRSTHLLQSQLFRHKDAHGARESPVAFPSPSQTKQYQQSVWTLAVWLSMANKLVNHEATNPRSLEPPSSASRLRMRIQHAVHVCMHVVGLYEKT